VRDRIDLRRVDDHVPRVHGSSAVLCLVVVLSLVIVHFGQQRLTANEQIAVQLISCRARAL